MKNTYTRFALGLMVSFLGLPAAHAAPCRAILSGSESMTFNCSVTAVYTAEEGKSGVTIIPESPITGTQQVHFSAVVDGVISAKGYEQSDLESFASTIIKGSSGSIPSGVYLAASSGEASGSETRMNLTSVIQRSSSAEGNVYEIHGTMDVKLMQVYPADAPGSVIARFEF